MSTDAHRERCANPGFEPIADLGHVESVDWDLGRCPACGAHLLRQWSEYAAGRVFYDELTDAEAEAFRRTQGRDRILLLKRWYADH